MAFDPATLFASGEQGVWLDPSDLSSMFQDSAGTVAAAVGQPVGRMNDKSGRGNHATQAAAASRPILRAGSGLYWLEFDGSNDALATPAFVLGASSSKAVQFHSILNTGTTTGVITETGPIFSNAQGSFLVDFNDGPVNRSYAALRGSASAVLLFDMPASGIYASVQWDLAASLAAANTVRLNGVMYSGSPSGAAPGGGQFSTSQPINIGSRNQQSLFAPMRLYGLIVVGRGVSAVELQGGEQYMGLKSGQLTQIVTPIGRTATLYDRAPRRATLYG